MAEATRETKKTTYACAYVTRLDDYWTQWLQRFSSFDKIVDVLAYCLRWRADASNTNKPTDSRLHLSVRRLARGRIALLLLVQREAFSEDRHAIISKGAVAASSNLSPLSPFLDPDGLLRVGGRLQYSCLFEQEQHPIILPGRHHVTKLLIHRAHLMTLHGGSGMLQALLSREYWIIRARNSIRQVVRQCTVCARFNAITLEQRMAPLPSIRVCPARPFEHTGVDYAGYFWIRASSGRGLRAFKGYAAVFVCLVTKAVHLECVFDLTAAAFLAAFRRFTARRGFCSTIYSDNGTNFKGAEAELRQLFAENAALHQEVSSTIARLNINWIYIPPRAPNFGGLWESNVRSMKRHLHKVMGDNKLTFEEFSTLLTQIEACMNSRPLCAASSDVRDCTALTPGHFLVGGPLLAWPSAPDLVDSPLSLRKRWDLVQRAQLIFWKRWRREYLATLQQRPKWRRASEQLKEGDLVLFKNTLSPLMHWPLARVIKLHPGSDGLVRVATIRAGGSEYPRPINRLIRLPVDEDTAQHLMTTKSLMAGGT